MRSDLQLTLLAGLGLAALGGCAEPNPDAQTDPTGSTGAVDTDGPQTGGSLDDGSTADDSNADDDTGSGPGEPDAPEARDGSRLHIEWFEPDSGPAQVLGIFDTELGVECSFRIAADKVLRCLPTTNANSQHLDAETEDRVPVREVTEECMPSYLVDDDAATSYDCDVQGWVVYEPGEFRTEVCNSISGGACTSTRTPGQDAPAGSGYLFLGDPVDPSTFVAGEIATPAGNTRLRRRFVEAEDGARIGWDVFDTQIERSCAFKPIEGGQLRCIPDAPSEGSGYVESIDDWVRYVPGNTACPPERIGGVDSPGSYTCDVATHTVYTVGEPVEEVCTSLTNGECTSRRVLGDDPPEGAAFFFADVEVEASDFVAGVRGPADDEGRIVAIEVVSDDGFRVNTGLMDTQLGDACTFTLAADGVRRCLPQTFSSGRHYDTRAMEWAPYRGGNEGCMATFIVYRPSAASFSCDQPRAQVHDVGGVVDQLCISTAVPGTCASWLSLSDEAPAGAALYVAGETVDPSEFVGGS